MNSIHKDQRGTGTIEIILIIVIVGIVGGVGWYVWHTKKNSDKALDSATSTSQNAGPHFSNPKSDKSKSDSTTKTQPTPATKTDQTQ